MSGRLERWNFAEPLDGGHSAAAADAAIAADAAVAADAAAAADDAIAADDAAVARPGDVFAIGRNYGEHIREMGHDDTVPIVVFLKARASLVADGTPLIYPAWTDDLQYEGELVALIGRAGRDIAEDRALEHVWGYAAGLDWTLRDRQRDSRGNGEPWFVAKNFAGAAAVGAFRRRSNVAAVSALEIVTTVNGEERQRAGCAAMRHGLPALVAHVSRVVPLSPGDAIFTGTPSGVGPVRPGDVVCCTIAGVGSVTTPVVAAAESA